MDCDSEVELPFAGADGVEEEETHVGEEAEFLSDNSNYDGETEALGKAAELTISAMFL